MTYCVGIAADDVPFGEFFVLPRKPRARSAAPEAFPPTRLAVMKAIGVAVPIAVIIGILGASLKLSGWWLWAVVGGGVGYCAQFLRVARDDSALRRWRSEMSGLLQSACRIADDMTRRSRAHLERLIIARERVRRFREECLHACADASESFKRRAFSRFWDGVQQSRRGAAQFRESLLELKEAQTTYFEFIKGTLHNFPLRHEGVELDGAVVAAVSGVSDCVRAAESDFEFASILEHKRTQSAVYEGFNQLAAETASLRDTLHGDFSNLLFETREQIAVQQESLKRLECVDRHAAASAYTAEQVSAVIEKYRLLA